MISAQVAAGAVELENSSLMILFLLPTSWSIFASAFFSSFERLVASTCFAVASVRAFSWVSFFAMRSEAFTFRTGSGGNTVVVGIGVEVITSGVPDEVIIDGVDVEVIIDGVGEEVIIDCEAEEAIIDGVGEEVIIDGVGEEAIIDGVGEEVIGVPVTEDVGASQATSAPSARSTSWKQYS